MPEIANPFESTEEKEDVQEYACTVVSLIPLELNEDKPQLLPSTYHIDAADDGDFTILHVKEAIHYVQNPLIEEGKPGSAFKVTTSPNEMARSICEDYKGAHIGLGSDAEPGLFWIPGKLSKKDVKDRYKKKLEEAKRKQLNWFRNLCALADADWNKNHNSLAVSDLQRAAAKALGIKKDWVEVRVAETKECPFCTISVPPNAIVCPNCKEVLDKEAYKNMKEQ